MAAGPLSAGTIPNGASYAAYEAALDGPDFDGVGYLTGVKASGVYLGEAGGSGWVLTAAHVGELSSSFTFQVNGTDYASTGVFIDPRWTGDIAGGGDLALIRLASPISGVSTPKLYGGTAADLVGETVTITGYGREGGGTGGYTSPRGTYHIGQNRIDRAGQQIPFFDDYDEAIIFGDFDDPASGNDGYTWSPNDALAYEYMISPGDSGGGVYINDNGAHVLVGVNSLLLSTDGTIDSSYTEIAGLTTLQGALPWIAQTSGVITSGDADLDGFIGQSDLDAVLLNWGQSNRTWSTGDFDGDTFVGQSDLDAVLLNWGSATEPTVTTAALPEPGTLVWAAAGVGYACLRHRRG